MEIRTLRSFLAVAREGNMTRAARSLHITQPALSRQIAELERELGCELAVREARGITLTDEGRLLRKRAEEIVGLADRAEDEIRSPQAAIEGDVWVGGGESRCMEIVARVATALVAEHPGIRLRLFSGNGNDVVERIDKGLLDFGLVMGQKPQDRFERLDLPWEDRWGLLVRRDDPLASREAISLEELKDLPLIVSSQSDDATTGAGSSFAFFAEGGYRVVATYTLLYNASLLVEQGLGAAVCFDGIVRAGEGTPFSYVPIDGLPTITSLLLWKRFQPQSRACEAFLSVLRAELDS